MPRHRWVLGILCEQYSPPRPIFQEVPNRTARVLMPLLKSIIKPGTTVMTDKWAAYNELDNDYDHRTVNHSANWVDPVTGEYSLIMLC